MNGAPLKPLDEEGKIATATHPVYVYEETLLAKWPHWKKDKFIQNRLPAEVRNREMLADRLWARCEEGRSVKG